MLWKIVVAEWVCDMERWGLTLQNEYSQLLVWIQGIDVAVETIVMDGCLLSSVFGGSCLITPPLADYLFPCLVWLVVVQQAVVYTGILSCHKLHGILSISQISCRFLPVFRFSVSYFGSLTTGTTIAPFLFTDTLGSFLGHTLTSDRYYTGPRVSLAKNVVREKKVVTDEDEVQKTLLLPSAIS